VANATMKSSLTVAGQWRLFTALPEHSANIYIVCDAMR
jgi:hypothetical protein